MLSFMREQGGGEPSASQTSGGDQRRAKASGSAGPQEYLTVAATSRNLRKSTTVHSTDEKRVLKGLGKS